MGNSYRGQDTFPASLPVSESSTCVQLPPKKKHTSHLTAAQESLMSEYIAQSHPMFLPPWELFYVEKFWSDPVNLLPLLKLPAQYKNEYQNKRSKGVCWNQDVTLLERCGARVHSYEPRAVSRTYQKNKAQKCLPPQEQSSSGKLAPSFPCQPTFLKKSGAIRAFSSKSQQRPNAPDTVKG